MPVFFTDIEARFKQCEGDLDRLFAPIPKNQDTRQNIDSVKEYYTRSYTRTGISSTETLEKIVARYEHFIEILKKIRRNEISFKDARKKIDNLTTPGYSSIIFFNLAKTCELLFWAAASLSLYAALLGVALPAGVIVQPLLGLALGITIGGILIKTAKNCLSCFGEFKSYERHRREFANEIDLLSFLINNPVKSQFNESSEVPYGAFCV